MYTRAKENSTGLIEQHVFVRILNLIKVENFSTRKRAL
ncbi:MAG: hypothetical protein ACD_19C00026G0003 [uncultured bacterium]|nr:MAG: hypothetical protein ACD_19C00026G0003 [uncultured bacterium]